jgi:hypothetical protein
MMTFLPAVRKSQFEPFSEKAVAKSRKSTAKTGDG